MLKHFQLNSTKPKLYCGTLSRFNYRSSLVLVLRRVGPQVYPI